MFQYLHHTVLKLEKTPNLHKFSPPILTIGYQCFTTNFQVSQIQTRGMKTYPAPGTEARKVFQLSSLFYPSSQLVSLLICQVILNVILVKFVLDQF